MMSNQRDLREEDDAQEFEATDSDVPLGWRPSRETIEAIQSGQHTETRDRTKDVKEDREEKELRELSTTGSDVPRGWRLSNETIEAIRRGQSVSELRELSDGHRVPATTIEAIDTLVDEKNARHLAASEYPRTHIDDLPDSNLRGIAYEGMIQRHLEDRHGVEHIDLHPANLRLADGRSISPDFVVKDDQGNITELHDAKGYARKEGVTSRSSASELTHLSRLQETGRYVDVTEDEVKSIVFEMPRETGELKPVQEAVADLSSEQRSVRVESVGSEADLKQRVDDLKTPHSDRFALSDHVIQEVERIQSLPNEQRLAAMGDLATSLQDQKGDEIAEGRNLRWSTHIERNGAGVTIRDEITGKEYKVRY